MKHAALDCIIDITTANEKCIKRGQTIYILKFALFIRSYFSIHLSTHATWSNNSQTNIQNGKIIHCNYTIFSARAQCQLTIIVIMLIIRALWYVTIHWKVLIFHLNITFSIICHDWCSIVFLFSCCCCFLCIVPICCEWFFINSSKVLGISCQEGGKRE